MRPLLRLLANALLRPSLLGALYLLILAWRAASADAADVRALGDEARAITSFVDTAFGSEVRRVAIAIAASAFVIGAALGSLAGALVRAKDALHERPAADPPRISLRAFPLIILSHALLFLYGMAEAPQLYANAFYAQGGLRRTLQVLTTDVLGRAGVTLVAAVAFAVYLGPALVAWGRAHAGAWSERRALRKAGAVGAAGAGVVALLVYSYAASSSAPRASSPKPSLAVAEARAESGAALEDHPNIVILAADSLRADRLDPRVAPTLSALADKSVRFDHAYVSLARTFPSWVTILTGREPHHHGIRSMFPRWEERTRDFDALPARLAKAGYVTAVVSDFAGDIFRRIDLGFADLDTPTFDFRQLVRQRALERETPLLPLLHSRLGRRVFPVLREMNAAADPQMLAHDATDVIRRLRDRPFFLTVFFSTAHFPYAAPAPYYQRFTTPDYRGRFKYDKPVGLGRDAPPDARDVTEIRALYDGAVASIDDAAKRVLTAIADAGIAGRTIVIVTADHGETLYENGHGQGHGDHLFGDEGTHVPLVVFDPRVPAAATRAAPHREAAVVRDVDLAPTLYALANVPPPGDLDGRSLAPALRGEALPAGYAFSESELWFTEEIPGLPSALRMPYPGIARLTEVDAEHGDDVVLQKAVQKVTTFARHRMVRDARFKLVYVPTRAGVVYLLFDTEADPGETRDVAAEHPAELAKLKGELWRYLLRDRDMHEQGGYLVPRDVSMSDEAAGLRLDSAPLAPEPAEEGEP